jgi:hypothetical protein
MPPKTSRDMPGSEPQRDKDRDEKSAEIQDADKTDTPNRDKVHGDGGDIGLNDNYAWDLLFVSCDCSR